MSSKTFKFTDKRLKALKPLGKRSYYTDTEAKGMRLSVTASGTKSFQFRKWDGTAEKMRTVTLGKYPDISIDTARNLAREYASDAAKGIAFDEQKKDRKAEETLDQFFERYMDQHGSKKDSASDDRSRYTFHISPHLGSRKMSDITPAAIQAWRAKLAKTKKQRGEDLISEAMQNRIISLLKVIFSVYDPNALNPVSTAKMYKEKSRTRRLNEKELAALYKVLQAETLRPDVADIIRFGLATGQRSFSIRAAKFNEFDLDRKVWTIPDENMKTDGEHSIPLVPQATEIIERRKAENALCGVSSVYLFPGIKDRRKHLGDFRKPFNRILTAAGIDPDGITWHDATRHTFGTLLAKNNIELPQIARLMGHRSFETTKKYINLEADDVRDAANGLDSVLKKLEESPAEKEKVVELRKAENN